MTSEVRPFRGGEDDPREMTAQRRCDPGLPRLKMSRSEGCERRRLRSKD